MKKLLLLFATVIFAFVSYDGFAKSDRAAKKVEQKIIVVSIPPVKMLVEKVVKDKRSVISMIPVSSNPHFYEPKPSQIRYLSDADIFVKLGSKIEFENNWINRFRELNKKMLIVDLSEGIKLKANEDYKEHAGDHHHDMVHTWLSIDNSILMIRNIIVALSKEDPENADYYRSNGESFITNLQSVKKEISNKLKNLDDRSFVVSHPAWESFADEFNLEEVSIDSRAKEISPKRLAYLVNYMKNKKRKIIFSSLQFNSKAVQTVAKESKSKIVFVEHISENYIEQIQKLVTNLVENE